MYPTTHLSHHQTSKSLQLSKNSQKDQTAVKSPAIESAFVFLLGHISTLPEGKTPLNPIQPPFCHGFPMGFPNKSYISTSSNPRPLRVLTGLALKSWRTNAETLRAVTFAAAQRADLLMATP